MKNLPSEMLDAIRAAQEPIIVRPSGTIVDLSKERFVAMFDILGYRRILERGRIASVVALTMQATDMAHFAASGRLVEGDTGQVSVDRRHPKVGVATYADTFLFYSQGSTANDLVEVVLAAHQFMGIMMMQGVLVRGSVTKGVFYASKKAGVFTGEAMIRAYEVEQSQEWAGCILDEDRIMTPDEVSALQVLEEKGFLLRFPAPMKEGPMDRRLCLGWPLRHAMSEQYWSEQVSKVYGKRDWPAFVKFRHTADFFHNHRRKWPMPDAQLHTDGDGNVVGIERDWKSAEDVDDDTVFRTVLIQEGQAPVDECDDEDE